MLNVRIQFFLLFNTGFLTIFRFLLQEGITKQFLEVLIIFCFLLFMLIFSINLIKNKKVFFSSGFFLFLCFGRRVRVYFLFLNVFGCQGRTPGRKELCLFQNRTKKLRLFWKNGMLEVRVNNFFKKGLRNNDFRVKISY